MTLKRIEGPPWIRFWPKVNKNGRWILDTQCWEWTGSVNERGYGRFYAGDDERMYAHRFAWELLNGEVPADKILCHRCDNPSCVRQDHLFLGTSLENQKDCKEKGRMGERNKRLSEEVKRQLRDLYQAGVGTQELVRKFGLNGRTVRRWAKGENYSKRPNCVGFRHAWVPVVPSEEGSFVMHSCGVCGIQEKRPVSKRAATLIT